MLCPHRASHWAPGSRFAVLLGEQAGPAASAQLVLLPPSGRSSWRCFQSPLLCQAPGLRGSVAEGEGMDLGTEQAQA